MLASHRRPIRTRLTAREYLKICHDIGPSELERGEVIRLTAAGMGHSGPVANIAIILGMWARTTGLGRVHTGETGLITRSSPDTVRGIDVAYYSYDRLPKSKTPTGFSRTPPNLAVEVVGKGQGWRKMVEKAAEYLAMGVDRVWIVDPEKRRVCVLRSDIEPQSYGTRQTISDAEVLPGFRCKVAEFFAD